MSDSALYAQALPAGPIDPDAPLPLLGGLTPAAFMRDVWHRKPLLIRQAVPGIVPPVSREALFSLADRDDVESRLVSYFRNRWKLDHGPFAEENLPSRKTRQWSLLVQGVNLHNTAAAELMSQFRFIPDARLDDVMISYATDGGGVGPHFDSYDVFLLQVSGRRRWRISSQTKLDLVPDLPLKILSGFTAEEEFVLEPGDMLYLPPQYAHDGVAEGECMTASIGFRAPAFRELAGHFLAWLSETVEDNEDLSGRYADAGEAATVHPAQLPVNLTRAVADRLAAMRWTPGMVSEFLGTHLSEPKPGVEFAEVPDLTARKYAKLAQAHGVVLAPASIALYDKTHFFLNGEAYEPPAALAKWLRRLADNRCLTPEEVTACAPLPDLLDTFHDWTMEGWLQLMPARV
ncbi:cupin domain-containing protein [Cupriavidus plantarum]|uniref:50S ribosomal protein L16 3-hydroxylase n=1 Tax=Cupriavidus plantarum TaxID=942865 RepID=A0A316F305_9BURK|nr:cupin domain-containing protein [Cupriavidus plantarum]PWK37889.1 50S ribosomal protein L16 3-hydroxylase [Cupriavidus plantarum]REF01412.1 50S ribosomal protein L16 3-hydroxylase [Cupriavidus plantarum]RLK45729.1 50S ribosomal protein L16 3-hydroxylase [Cupriavidus plantarum]CAG2127917.1 50S ribosomal protein L16 3-hydroxylase [Cupriavidus plantarum]SMR66905.1 50S ribosomal protein L16 3-hydroxylase [Cupriavidus plantarum]